MSNARLVIAFLGALVILDLIAIAYLAGQQLPIPDVLVALATGALGSLGSILVSSRDSETRDRDRA